MMEQSSVPEAAKKVSAAAANTLYQNNGCRNRTCRSYRHGTCGHKRYFTIHDRPETDNEICAYYRRATPAQARRASLAPHHARRVLLLRVAAGAVFTAVLFFLLHLTYTALTGYHLARHFVQNYGAVLSSHQVSRLLRDIDAEAAPPAAYSIDITELIQPDGTDAAYTELSVYCTYLKKNETVAIDLCIDIFYSEGQAPLFPLPEGTTELHIRTLDGVAYLFVTEPNRAPYFAKADSLPELTDFLSRYTYQELWAALYSAQTAGEGFTGRKLLNLVILERTMLDTENIKCLDTLFLSKNQLTQIDRERTQYNVDGEPLVFWQFSAELSYDTQVTAPIDFTAYVPY